MATLRKHLKLSEGFSAKPYRCTEGKLTIGYGFNIEDRGIPVEVADYWLEHEMSTVIDELRHACGDMAFSKSIDGERIAVLVDMAYNLGVPRLLGFTKMFKALDNKDYDTAADEMLDSRWARQVKGRAVRLSNVMRSGSWP